MSKLKSCPACENEVAKSAKACPKCGKKLKIGFFKKALIGLGGLIAISVVLAPSAEEKRLALAKEIEAIATAPLASDVSPAELGEMYSIMNDYTDIQRDNKEKEIIGKVVEWNLEVYDVNKRGENEYHVQTGGRQSAPGAYISLYTRSPEEAQYIEGLKTGDMIKFKGRISGTTLRNIDFDKAVLAGRWSSNSLSLAKKTAQVVSPSRENNEAPLVAAAVHADFPLIGQWWCDSQPDYFDYDGQDIESFTFEANQFVRDVRSFEAQGTWEQIGDQLYFTVTSESEYGETSTADYSWSARRVNMEDERFEMFTNESEIRSLPEDMICSSQRPERPVMGSATPVVSDDTVEAYADLLINKIHPECAELASNFHKFSEIAAEAEVIRPYMDELFESIPDVCLK